MSDATTPGIPNRGSHPWFPPGLNSAKPCVEIPGLPYRVVWDQHPQLAPKAGGMGQAWPGEHVTTGEQVYLKFFDPKSHSPNDQAWSLLKAYFGCEARADLSGDHLLSSKTHAQLDDPWRPVLVMERAAASLDDVLADLRRAGQKLPLWVIKQLVFEAAKGLQRLHEIHQLIHDDIKPGNLFLRLKDSGRYAGAATLEQHSFEVAVGDFGFARKIGEVREFAFRKERPDNYKAPEQCCPDQTADVRTDLYGLGRVLEEFLKHSRDPVPSWLTQRANQCKKDDVQERPPCAAAVAWELSSVRDRFRNYGIDPDKHNPFVKRSKPMKDFERFRHDPDLRILHLKGDPGTGKTALMTHWAGQVVPGESYFLSGVDGRSSFEAALRDLLQGLKESFEINMPARETFDQRAVTEALQAVMDAPSKPIPEGESLWLYIDALDEADRPFDVARLLPTKDLPLGIKLVVSSRHEPRFDDLETAPHRLEVRLDDPADQEQNLSEAWQFCRQQMGVALSTAECAAVAEALEGNFQRIQIYCGYLRQKHDQGQLDHAELGHELTELRRDFGGSTRGEEAFHRFYRKYVWDVAVGSFNGQVDSINLLTRLAGLLAVAEAAVPLDVLATLTGLEGEDAVQEALRPLRRNLRAGSVHGSDHAHLPSYRYAHKTIQTFITSPHGPLKNPDSAKAKEYRALLLEYYQKHAIKQWDHFGLAAFVLLVFGRSARIWRSKRSSTRTSFTRW